MPSAIQPYSATVVVAEHTIALGKKSGLANIKIKLDELVSMRRRKSTPPFSRRSNRATTEKRLVTDQEFRAIVAQVA